MRCPYCESEMVKKGFRKKKYEDVQVYYCKKCEKKITPSITKNRTYPLRVIQDSLTQYNLLKSPAEISAFLKETYGLNVSQRIIRRWVDEFMDYTPFLRMRDFVKKNYDDFLEQLRFFHKQVFNFCYHRAKLDLLLNEEFRHSKLSPLKEFLELVVAECPHHKFKDSCLRASDFKDVFNLQRVKIIKKNNRACATTGFVTQAVANRLRHEKLQEFMIANDSVTVAAEVPIILESDDVRHFKHELNFYLPFRLDDGQYITGHIDLLQVRNGLVHIMDFKPNAKREKPISQLTIYALALSRHTGLRLYNFKCAWFDKHDYFEFFPLHVVHKKVLENQKTLAEAI